MLWRENQDQGQPVPPVNPKRVHRIWHQAGLCLPMRRPRPRRRGQAAKAAWPQCATHPNHIWTYDFVHDACAKGMLLKMLTVIDEFTRKSLAIEVGSSLPAQAVIAVLARLFAQHGAPEFLRSDNGPEFIAHLI